jgi:hypothetical protein
VTNATEQARRRDRAVERVTGRQRRTLEAQLRAQPCVRAARRQDLARAQTRELGSQILEPPTAHDHELARRDVEGRERGRERLGRLGRLGVTPPGSCRGIDRRAAGVVEQQPRARPGDQRD